MIVFLTTKAHDYTLKDVAKWKIADIRLLSYDALFQAKSLPEATYVFTDFDRLGFWELELAADAYRNLSAAGMRVLNDPARACQRYSLLKALKAEGINRFNIWRVEDGEWPDRYPVFLRFQSAHRGPLSGLLATSAEVERQIEWALSMGHPRKELMLVEYCAEPIRGQLFRKLASFRIGDRVFLSLSVHEQNWVAKEGQVGLADQADYEWEQQALAENRYSATIKRAFEIAELEYGRADFGLVSGTPQIYEINTNPHIPPGTNPHIFSTRTANQTLARQNFIEALTSIDTPSRFWNRKRIPNAPLILEQMQRDPKSAVLRWTP